MIDLLDVFVAIFVWVGSFTLLCMLYDLIQSVRLERKLERIRKGGL